MTQKKKKINLFEAFSGIGSQHRALENIGFEVTSVGISDWYIDAIIAYGVEYLGIKGKKIDKNKTIEFLRNYSLSRDSKKPLKSFAGYSEEQLSILEQVIQKFGNLDINHIHGQDLVDKDIDLFTYSFPCQDISQQGKRSGFSRGQKSRSGLLWEIERILQEIKAIDPKKLPKYLMMENVKAILNKEFAPDLQEWKDELTQLGYESTDAFVVNASDVGSVQNRSRVFMISKLLPPPNLPQRDKGRKEGNDY
ncbi:DNA cytosine methyltransferase, partial [Candidatus Gracilibacteria bacterium]|nr:DNA cytosine methyltransferase [Candidatus Gracilibacteria bacterium]